MKAACVGTKTITMYVSDIDKSEIAEGQAYQLSIRHPDGSTQQLDISEKNYRDLGRPQLHPARVDLDDPATALANQMVMVNRIAEAEQRLPGFAPEHVHPARIDQPLKGAVD